MCSSRLCTVTLHNAHHENILFGVYFIQRMFTFIYCPYDSGVFDNSIVWKSVFVVPKRRTNNFINSMYSRKLSENDNLKIGCKNDQTDDVYVTLRC
jgi:hypothetical protein